MTALTYQQIEYLQYAVKETAFKNGNNRNPEVQALKDKLIKMRAELESKKGKDA